MNDTPSGWIHDSGLDPQSVASMTPDEAKEYLTLGIRYVVPGQLPSVTWLRRAAAITEKSGSDSHLQRRDPMTPDESRSPDAAKPSHTCDITLGPLLHDLLRGAPVTFQFCPNARRGRA
jgi:hypothetical protein